MQVRTKRRPYGEGGIIRAMSYAEARDVWMEIAEDLADPDVELTVEEFAPVVYVFCLLARYGREFDPVFVALMGKLERQAELTDDGDPWGDLEIDADEDGDDNDGEPKFAASLLPAA